MNIIESCEQGSAEWLSMRLSKVTASRVKDVLSKGRGKECDPGEFRSNGHNYKQHQCLLKMSIHAMCLMQNL